MKNKHFITLVLTSIMIIGIPSCAPCEGPLYTNYKFNDFYNPIAERFQNNTWTTITDSVTSNVDDLRFRMPASLKMLAFSLNRSKSNPFFIQSSYACDPVIYENVDKQIIDFSIYSSNDINENYPAGSNLSSLFFGSNYHTTDSLKNSIKKYPNEILLGRPVYYLKQHPKAKGKHMFTFKIKLNDTTITKTTEEILIE